MRFGKFGNRPDIIAGCQSGGGKLRVQFLCAERLRWKCIFAPGATDRILMKKGSFEGMLVEKKRMHVSKLSAEVAKIQTQLWLKDFFLANL